MTCKSKGKILSFNPCPFLASSLVKQKSPTLMKTATEISQMNSTRNNKLIASLGTGHEVKSVKFRFGMHYGFCRKAQTVLKYMLALKNFVMYGPFLSVLQEC